jgi:succinate dehydrogenase flavin-adding protein (antitoxin of CptAB toxin-antitoxin module)
MLSDTELIVNKGKLPEAWIQPFRERVEAVQRKGGSERKLERIGHKARRRSLRNIDRLIKFFHEQGITDEEETHRALLAALQERWNWVAAAEWQDLLASAASTQDEAEPPDEN